MSSEGKPLRLEIETNLKEVLAAQEERTRVLNDFDARFKGYLAEAPEFDLESLKTLCHVTSTRMNEISTRILSVRDQFECFGLTRLSSLINDLQEAEQSKFKLVIHFSFPRSI